MVGRGKQAGAKHPRGTTDANMPPGLWTLQSQYGFTKEYDVPKSCRDSQCGLRYIPDLNHMSLSRNLPELLFPWGAFCGLAIGWVTLATLLGSKNPILKGYYQFSCPDSQSVRSGFSHGFHVLVEPCVSLRSRVSD